MAFVWTQIGSARIQTRPCSSLRYVNTSVPDQLNSPGKVHYCAANGIDAVDLPTLLRLFWTQQFATRVEVEQMIRRMEQVERLVLSAEHRAAIFAPRRQHP
jgi:hypothetical protein